MKKKFVIFKVNTHIFEPDNIYLLNIISDPLWNNMYVTYALFRTFIN